jgi:putative DNA methylase
MRWQSIVPVDDTGTCGGFTSAFGKGDVTMKMMTSSLRSVLVSLDASAASTAARAEARSREHHLPVISLYRWWARRTRAITDALLEGASLQLGDHMVVADPFAGGGVIALSALTQHHTVVAQEIDPWAARNLATMATPGNPADVDQVETFLAAALATTGDAYLTTMSSGEPARVATTLRVATSACPACTAEVRLYPGALVTRNRRVDGSVPTNASAWFACRAGHLHLHRPVQHNCPTCARRVRTAERYTVGRRVTCWSCRKQLSVAEIMSNGVEWKPILVQRVCGRTAMEFAEPSPDELVAANPVISRVNLGAIPDGSETAALLRHGFRDFSDLYPTRQLATLQRLLLACDDIPAASPWARQVAKSCVIGAAEFAGLATRWDPSYLKPYETIASHRFNITTLSAEVDPWGERGRGTVRRRLAAARRAAVWLALEDVPTTVHTRTGASRRTRLGKGLTVITGTSSRLPVPSQSVDLILTDPPYHDDVQYAQLATMFRAWSDDVLGQIDGDVTAPTSSGAVGLARFEELLTEVFVECRRTIKPNGHLVLSFANRTPGAWSALFSSLQRAGWFGCGFEVVHSENDSDHAKAGRRACTLDVVIDLTSTKPGRRHHPKRSPQSDEERYCFIAGSQALKIGLLRQDWRTCFEAALRREGFVSDRSVRPDSAATG